MANAKALKRALRGISLSLSAFTVGKKARCFRVSLSKGTPNTPKHAPEMERTIKKRVLLTAPSRKPSTLVYLVTYW